MPCLPFAFVVFAICQNVLCRFPHFLHFSACLYLFSASFFRSPFSIFSLLLPLFLFLLDFVYALFCRFAFVAELFAFACFDSSLSLSCQYKPTLTLTHTHLLLPINIYTHTHSVWSPLWLAHRASIGTRPAWIFIDFAVVGCSDWSIDWLINWHFAH